MTKEVFVCILTSFLLGCGKTPDVTALSDTADLMSTLTCIDNEAPLTPAALITYTLKTYSDGSYKTTCTTNQDGESVYKDLDCPTTTPNTMTFQAYVAIGYNSSTHSNIMGWVSSTVTFSSSYNGCTETFN